MVRRIFLLLMACVILGLALLPVSAAEAASYAPAPDQDVGFWFRATDIPTLGSFYACPDFLPPGEYLLHVYNGAYWQDPMQVSVSMYSSVLDPDLGEFYCATVSLSDGSIVELVLDVRHVCGYSVVTSPVALGAVFCFVPADDFPSLADSVNVAMFDGAWSECLSLLPVCIPVLCGYGGIRKALAWLFRLLLHA